MTESDLPTPLTDLRRLAPVARATIRDLLTQRLGDITLTYDFSREWNGTWVVRVVVAGAARGTLDFTLMRTPGGGVLALPRPFPKRWRVEGGMAASDGSVWTLTDDEQLIPFQGARG
jgi:hypothetical protein